MKPKILSSDKCGKKGIKIPTRQTKGTVPILVPLSQVSCTALLDLKKKKSKSCNAKNCSYKERGNKRIF